MAAIATKTETPLANPTRPVYWDDYQAEKAARKAAQDKKQPALRKMLDWRAASQAEARKPIFEWTVTCKYSRRDKKGRVQQHSETREVVSQNEDGAWAAFCDSIEEWPGPNSGERTITRGKQVN